MLTKAYIALGSNIGDRLSALRRGAAAVSTLGKLEALSSIYKSAPMYITEQPAFFNAVMCISTTTPPMTLLEQLLEAEKTLGRERKGERFGPRSIDLDLLLYGDIVLDTSRLILPHPRMLERRFVLTPLSEIAPSLQHPTWHHHLKHLEHNCSDPNPPQRSNLSWSFAGSESLTESPQTLQQERK